jgi:hypothetical protein
MEFWFVCFADGASSCSIVVDVMGPSARLVLMCWLLPIQVSSECRVQPVTDCDDLCAPSLLSPRIQVVRFAGRVASFGCISLRSTWVREAQHQVP